MNLSNTIIPKSDQLNADDLIAGPRTIKITAVESGSSEQPVLIRYEGDNGRPYKPGKSMRRVLVAMWGSEGSAYVGRRLTLYCDKTITFGPETTGGIRISHASDISEPVELALTVKRGKRKPFRVEPLPAEHKSGAENESFDVQTLSDVGDTKSHQGIAALQAWWGTLPSGAKKALKPKLDGEWKANAQAKDGSA
jgi:hypothetical protein